MTTTPLRATETALEAPQPTQDAETLRLSLEEAFGVKVWYLEELLDEMGEDE